MYDFINVILYSFASIVSIYLAHKYSDNLRKLYFKRTIDEVNEEIRIRNEIILHDIKTMTDPIYQSEGSSYFDTSSQELSKYRDGQWRTGYKLDNWSEISRFTMMKGESNRMGSNAECLDVMRSIHDLLSPTNMVPGFTFVGVVNKFDDIKYEFPNPEIGNIVHINYSNTEVIYDGVKWSNLGSLSEFVTDDEEHGEFKHKYVNCINCGAPSGDSYYCEYCGSLIVYYNDKDEEENNEM